MPLLRRVVIFLLLSLSAAAPAQAARLALVIGNDSYSRVESLRNARADAKAMARALEAAGFRVSLALDQDQNGMKAVLRRFKASIAGGDEAVFFYAGHGVELGGVNYLLPTDIRDDSDDQLQDDAIPLQRVLNDLAQQKPKFSLAIIDACRDDPFKGSGRNVGSRGLAPVSAVTGQMVIYSAGAGQKALDRLSEADKSPNGVFTRVLVKAMEREGVSVQDLVGNVREEVARLAASVGREQVPAAYDQVIGKFYFRRGTQSVSPTPIPGGRDVDFSDLETAQGQEFAARQRWDVQQKAMQASFNKARTLNATPEIAIQAWERFLGAYADDNPYSSEDERLRTDAMALLLAARERAARLSATPVVPKASIWDEFDFSQPVPKAQSTGSQPKPPPASASRAPDSTVAGSSFRDCDECPEMVVLAGGSYLMGSPDGKGSGDERPQHRVNVQRFALGKYEVTQGQWRAVMGSNPSYYKNCGDDCPVENVSWEDAQSYVKKLNQKVGGMQYRMPSESEWEYGCRGGAGQEEYCGGDDLEAVAWYVKNSGDTTHRVGTKRGNGYGLHDMSGNVWEWTQDCYAESYAGAPTDGSAVMGSNCARRVARGGSWGNILPRVRSASRNGYAPSWRFDFLGFRVARTLP